MEKTYDVHIDKIESLVSPRELKEELPLTSEQTQMIVDNRQRIRDILEYKDKRLLAVVGPCSIHDPEAAMEYARKLKELAERVSETIMLVMRVYFEKPRTTIGWKGLITDPHLDGTYDVATGLRVSRRLLLDITSLGLPCGSEMLDPIVPQYLSDLVCWAAIGARTTESQTHREMSSGLSMPIGFKNGTSGDLQLAVNAMQSARHPQSFIGIDQDGKVGVFQTTGNSSPHLILRGGRSGPNYYAEVVEETASLIAAAGFKPAVIIDCSHANSGKDHARQARVLRSLLSQKKEGNKAIVGFMLESNLKEGNQKLGTDHSLLNYGQSITDACIGWDETAEILLDAHQVLKKI